MEKILITGGSGMVGRNLMTHLPEATYISSKDCNLTQQADVKRLIQDEGFDRIIHAAPKVGGLEHNMMYQYDYFYENNLMNTLLLDCSRTYGIKRFTAILSSCIFPSVASKYPMTEAMMHESAPSQSNYGYAISKRALASGIDCLNRQYGFKYNYIIPCNLYGKYDKTGSSSHYVAALIKKIHEALTNDKDHITLMGDGTPLREFLYADDLAQIISLMVENDITESFNVSNGELYTIDQIARIGLKACGAEHLKIKYEQPHMNGQFRKDCDTSKFKSLFPNFQFVTLEEGIAESYEHYKQLLAQKNG